MNPLTNNDALNIVGKILARLTEIKQPVTVLDNKYYFHKESGVLELRVQPLAGSTARAASLVNAATEIGLCVGVPATRVYVGATAVHIEVPVALPEIISASTLVRLAEPGVAVIGKTLTGAPVYQDFANPDTPHVLAAGTSGSGKSALWHTMAITLAAKTSPGAVRFVVYDPVHARPAWLLPHISKHLARPMMSNADEMMVELNKLYTWMSANPTVKLNPRIIVFVDEAANLIRIAGDQARNVLAGIAEKGRNNNLHLVIGTQKPTAAVLDSVLVSNLSVKLVLRMTSESDSRHAAGGVQVGAHKLPGRGAGVLVRGGHEPVRFNAGLPDGYEASTNTGTVDFSTLGETVMDNGVTITMPPTPRIAQAAQNAAQFLPPPAPVRAPRRPQTLGEQTATNGARAPVSLPAFHFGEMLREAEDEVITQDATTVRAPTPSPEGDVRVTPLVQGGKHPDEYTIEERVMLVYAWNPRISKNALVAAVGAKGRANGFYVVDELLKRMGITLGN